MNLPKELDPIKACQAGQTFAGTLPATLFARLQGLQGSVHYQLSCTLNEKKEPVISLSFNADFNLRCQRCNQPMPYVMHETMLLDEETIFDPTQVLEDELILALPMIPMHAEKDCSFVQNEAYCAARTETNTHKPFANLGKVIHLKE